MSIQDISGDERYTSVCLHTTNLVLTSDSSDLPFAAATSRLGCEVAVKARTKAVEKTLRFFDVQDAVEVAGFHIPIVSSIEAFDDVCLYLYDAALVRDEQVLVVWCDETTAIVEQYRRMEHRLRHFVSDCTCGGGQYPLDLDASVKEQGDARYAGYDGNFDETVRKRLLDPSEPVPKGPPAVNSASPLGEMKVPTQVKASSSGSAGVLSAIQDTGARVYGAVNACPRTMGKAGTSTKYDNVSKDMVVCDPSTGNGNQHVDSLVGREKERMSAAPAGEAYATRPYGRTSQPQSRGGKYAPPTNSTRVGEGVGHEQSSHQTSRDTTGSQEPLPRITAAQKEKWRATDRSIEDEDAGSSIAAPGVMRRSQPSRNAKRKSPSTDNNDRIDGSSGSRNKKQKKTHAAPPPRQKQFVCPREKCEHEAFGGRGDFHRHLVSCFEIKQFFCLGCGKLFARKDATIRHVRNTSCDRSQDPTGNNGGSSTQIGIRDWESMESVQVSDATIHLRATQLGVSMEDLAYVLSFLTELETALLISDNEDNDEGAD
ncbi:predicted protein [Postia placenta Mad-698-R]|uniref:C2H2-type domain-containing protein n=1 Tax=Postia placenta MAD-698-R-SB12 TaxID=670580 RepID=A0A1X6MLB8_9APHY|nr:hypothetical protein POSPLADRAFT_1157996 [Postia placenta MAD-698-R-SB12]EED80847.1 predicted protein [Postia placenta Mad-698-R]OSX56883.1 hypothetical protein POSPLADRAFT_1157996 [Postia placenta MAD-698-R-SB12]